MFAKLKKKIAEEAATAPRTSVRIPRSISKESITSVGADSGDDFASDGSSSRDDVSAQILRRNDQIRKLEAKLSASMRKLQDQNESHQASRAKMAEGMALALEKKDQEWLVKMAVLEKEKTAMAARVEEMMEQSLTLFQRRDDQDELEGFQQQELAKVKHMLLRKEELLSQRERELQQKESEVQTAKRRLGEAQGKLQALEEQHEESCRLNTELEIEREELLVHREEAEKKITELEGRGQELQTDIQQVSEDFKKSQSMVASLEQSLHALQTEHDALKVQQQKAAVTEEDKERLLVDLQKKVTSLERRLEGNLSQDEHLQELLKEKCSLEQSLEEARAELLVARTSHADTVSSLEAQISRMSCNVTELQTLLRHKDDSSKAYRERTDAQVSKCLLVCLCFLQQAEWSAEKAFLDQQVCLLQQQSQERASRLEENITTSQTERQTLQARIVSSASDFHFYYAELSSRQTVSVEIAKALEDTRRQKEELQTQVCRQTHPAQVTAETRQQLPGEDITVLHDELQRSQASLVQLQEDAERQRAQMEQRELDKDSQLSSLREELLTQTQQLDCCQARISFLEVEVETLTEQLHTPEVCDEDQNGSVTMDDLDHIQKVNRDLEQQLSEKNKTIKQLQQRLAELKRTLQKELKLKPDPEAEGKEKLPESRVEKQERVCPDPPPASSPSPPTSKTTVTNTSDLNDSREINFEYLKHVVLKFMSSRDAEAYQLIRAVSVLLNFTREEEDMLKETLEYKMSWFGSKPSPRGIIRPSISGASAHWS
uniref:Golgin subfamily A member 1 n=1 Tax=Myripristis murdjan TaxID=586833 RepID=A0A667Y0F7_9TELE